MNLRQKTVAFTIAVLAVLVHSTNAGQFTFEKIAAVTPNGGRYTSPIPSLNNNGDIAFFGVSPLLPTGLYVGNSLHLDAYHLLGPSDFLLDVPIINNQREVAFTYLRGFMQGGLYKATSTSATPILQRPYPLAANYGTSGHSIDDQGRVVFAAMAVAFPRSMYHSE
jgi:hypothetical protein